MHGRNTFSWRFKKNKNFLRSYEKLLNSFLTESFRFLFFFVLCYILISLSFTTPPFLTDILYVHVFMEKVYREQQAQNPITTPFTVFRGQGLSHEYFDKMKQTKEGLMACNNFLSTSQDRQVSLAFACQSNPDHIAILFVIRIDPKVCEKSSIPFVDVKNDGYFKNEEEILFASHSIFRLEQMDQMKDGERRSMWEVHLSLIGDNDKEMDELTGSLHKEMGSSTGCPRLGQILIKIGESDKAEQLY